MDEREYDMMSKMYEFLGGNYPYCKKHEESWNNRLFEYENSRVPLKC